MELESQNCGTGGEPGDPAKWCGRLERMLDEQRGLCERLDEMSIEQGRLVAAGDADGALAVIADREAVVRRVAELNAAMEPFRAVVGQLDAEHRQRLRAQAEKVAELAARVRERDQLDACALTRQKEGVERELAGMARARGAVAAYGAREGAGAAFQDRHG